jgi:hypothetical protein
VQAIPGRGITVQHLKCLAIMNADADLESDLPTVGNHTADFQPTDLSSHDTVFNHHLGTCIENHLRK